MNKLFVFSALLLAGCSSESGSLFDNKNEYVDTGEDLPSVVSAMFDPNTENGKSYNFEFIGRIMKGFLSSTSIKESIPLQVIKSD
ncbi:hypothetical protein [uncultured Bacteroides sp.]|mgnify:CR=1 FL=1|uniref:hypothetical protein n=1 Tax=uncultured Bacteroides sp. TaxID=162156 RepID=UPI0025DC0BC5|nr:hypothetical protein [uncultured Bacteroides sp.]